eukprot:CAMPEP_0181337936 /NCGR_PEP_ID=MMETSP1101-20121128/28336_1 /TAXON_ID=46948 /ORGANISM="Rhodomonas abbreviata, Strain Caron Lab Isolate" /LENGTH=486 /DNA_ID=CAMNT_0023448567 /DNA_START=275 /DNA_END=1732 /DNA_ORIENTATION=-
MAGEVSWEDVQDVKEIIADIRDPDCDMRWVIFGYSTKDMKKLSVVDAGAGGLDEVVRHLKNTRVMFAFLMLEEKAFAFFQWCPEGASGMEKARASIHRSFITSYLGSVSVDLHAERLEDLSQGKIDEEYMYSRATAGRQLDSSEAQAKLAEESRRKEETVKRQAVTGNTFEAQKTLAKLGAAGRSMSTTEQGKLHTASGTNASSKIAAKSLSHTILSKAKIDVEFEEEDVLKELILDLREAEVGGDFDWMLLGYAEEKKNTLQLIETGAGGREAVVEYINDSLAGGLDRVLYILIKEDDSTNKCTFVAWIGMNVAAFRKANTSTHRGAISNWVTRVVHNLQEEYCQSGNDLLGLKEEGGEGLDASVLPAAGEGVTSATLNESMSNVFALESKMYSKPGTGKVLEDVVREKTPHELWLERKQAGLPPKHQSSRDILDASMAAASDPDFKQVVLKSKNRDDPSKRRAGRSKYAQQLEGGRSSGEGTAS